MHSALCEDSMKRGHQWWHLLVPFITIVAALPVHAEPPDDAIERTADDAVKVGRASNRIVVPVPFVGPQLGAGLALGAVWFYSPAAGSRPWTSAIAGLGTSNGSWGLVGLHKMSLGADRARIDITAAYGNSNSIYYGIGSAAGELAEGVGINQKQALLQARGVMRIADNLFVGGKLRFLDTKTTVRDQRKMPPDIDLSAIESHTRVFAIGPVFTFDRTDSAFAPRSGTLIDGQLLFGIPVLGSDNAYNKANLTANYFVPAGARTVVAFRGSLCSASGSTPFFELCQFGSSANLRGYPNGQYRDQFSWAVQTELRQMLGGKFGIVAFAGIGGVAKSAGDVGSSPLLPSAGAGVRYELSRDYGVNLRIDGAVGRNSHVLYVSIGEAF